jgi:hypothetical protein
MRKVVNTPIEPPRVDRSVTAVMMAMEAGIVHANPMPWATRMRRRSR